MEVTAGEKHHIQLNDLKWEALLRISEESHAAKNIDEFAATIHEILGGLVRCNNIFIGLYEEHSGKYFFPYFVDRFDSIETAGLSMGFDESLEVTLYDLSGTFTDYVRRTGRVVRFPNEEMSQLYEKGEIKHFGSSSISWMGVPLKHAGRIIGVLAVQSYDIENAYSEKDEELMIFVSGHIAQAIENVRAEERNRKQQQLVLNQSRAITDSIKYAQKIQSAVLPSPPYIRKILGEYYVIFKPKDIISGDFYWVREISGKQVVILADCTGHGVPGALMSMLGITLLNEQFRTYGIQQPDQILGHLRRQVKETLAQENPESSQKDGIDMSIAIIDPENHELQFAGANRPLFLFRRDEEERYRLEVIKGDRQPVGAHWDERDFTNHVVKLKEDDAFCMFSDGYVDQYGGAGRKKFKNRKFRELLLSVQDEAMETQHRKVERTFNQWRGMQEQIDDVCVFAWKFILRGNRDYHI